MDNIKDYQVESFSNLVADRFLSDPRIKYTIQGIEDKYQFLKKYGKSEIEAFAKTNNVKVIGEDEGIIIAYSKKDMGWFALIKAMLTAQNSLFKSISKEEKKIVINNSKKVKKVTDLSWHKKAVNTKGYYHILNIAIREDLKGKGIFRNLITPLIEECDKKNICIVLETNNSDNIPIYKHFGFEIYETLKSEEIDLVQYSMIKYPEHLAI
ncbi:MAG: GNAT family N-acetyltransferase [Clostridium sp.]